MDNDLEHLKSTTFGGRRFTRKQLVQIRETIRAYPNLSRRELSHTFCEHFSWLSTAINFDPPGLAISCCYD